VAQPPIFFFKVGIIDSMIIIKRYPNRKLYDTTEKQYITLEHISELIRDGVDIQVVDYASGEDLTAVTLTQIIFEQEKKQAGFLPRPLLTGLVKAGGETLDSVRRTLTKPLELLAHVDDEIERRLDVLVEQGDLTPEQAARLGEQLVEAGRPKTEGAQNLDRTLKQILNEHAIPSRRDYDKLIAQLDILTQRVEELTQSK